MITEAALVSFIAALLSMMNPVGNLGIFAGLTENRAESDTKRAAWVCAAAVTITLLVVVWAGGAVMKFFGITVDSMRAAGGIIVLLIGLNMLFHRSDHAGSPAEHEDAKSRSSIAVVPMAIPIVAGPGTMATVLVAAQQNATVLSKIEISVVIAVLASLVGLLFSFATPIAERLGAAGMGVVTRIMGLILAAIAMGMLAEGLRALLPGLAG